VTPGWDVIGIVEAVGFDTPEFRLGDEVFAYVRKSVIHAWKAGDVIHGAADGVGILGAQVAVAAGAPRHRHSLPCELRFPTQLRQ
jgi:NADPH:quinone reductase-like Zn-dependent oxidoreductase